MTVAEVFVGNAASESILLTTHVDSQTWDTFVRAHPGGSPFHLMAWQRMVNDSFGHIPFHLAAQDHMGCVVGVLPLFLVRSRIFGRMLVSTPQAAYGGILARSEAVSQAIFKRASEIARELNVQFLELRNFRNVIPDDKLLKKDLYVTFRQELREDPEANMLAIPR